jgi:CSLREA domain-containing protein
MFWWRGFLAFLLCAALAVPVAGQGSGGTTIYVDTLADDVTVNGNCTLREAILAANRDQPVDGCPAGSGNDTIILPAGTIKLTIPGTLENEGLTGDLDIHEGLKIIGAGMHETIIDGGQLDRVFDVHELFQYGPVEFQDLTIRGGRLTSMLFDPEKPILEERHAYGGGIRIDAIDTHVILTRVRVMDNFVDDTDGGVGAGIHNEGRLEIYHSQILRNTGAATGGGMFIARHLHVEDSIFEENRAYGQAAIHLQPGASARVLRTGFYGHSCGPAGWVITVSPVASLEIDHFWIMFNDCEEATILNEGSLKLANGVFENNLVAFGAYDGGGIILQRSGSLRVKNVAFQRNTAQAAIFVSGGHARIEESLFHENRAAALAITAGSAEMINSTVSSASTGDLEGGGVHIEGGFVRLESVTLANLQSSVAALYASGGSLTVLNSLLGYNRDRAGVPRDCSLAPGTTISGGYNLISVADGCGWRSATGDLVGTRAAPLDPRLGPLTEPNIPGRKATQPPLTGSPAIDAGDPQRCPPVDQRGVTRPQGPRCDIGAHEVEGGLPITGEFQVFLPLITR